MKIRTLLCSMLLLLSLTAMADDVQFTASAPKQVVMGQPFQLTYSVNQRSKDLRAPEMEHFDILAGPYTSTSSSTQFVNGHRTSSFSQTYTYTLLAREEGTFTIQPATITVDHESYTSNGLRITVLPEDEQPANNNNAAASSQRQTTQTSSSNGEVSKENIFIRTQLTKTKVMEQECILLQYKIYWVGVDLAQFTNNTKIPEYKGFLKQEIEQNGDVQTNLEHYNGRNYNTAVIYQTLLFPQKSGDIQIEPASFEAVLRVQNRSQVRSIFDDFFASYSNVTKTLVAPAAKVHVTALPSGKPTDFSGGVGHFTLTSNISTMELSTNEAVTIKLNISGSGNMKMLKTPAIDWPDGFEAYDPKVTNNFKVNTSGVSGSKTIEYLAIPRSAGDFTLPAINFSYYDTQENKYKTLSTQSYTLHVKRGADDQTAVVNGGSYVSKEDIKQLGEDIRYIASSYTPAKQNPLPFGSRLFWSIYAGGLFLAIALLLFFRKRIRENADLSRVRYKKANKVAQKRLKTARRLLSEQKKEAFYEEIERAAWTYLSDRLSIPTANLNKENISDLLRQKGVDDSLISEVISLLSDAEFARYAPSSSSAMDEMYEHTVQLIDKLENKHL